MVAATLVPDQGGAMLPSERMIRRIVQRSPAPRLTIRKPDSVMPKIARKAEAPFTDRLSPDWVRKSASNFVDDNSSMLADHGPTPSTWAPFTYNDLIETSQAASMRQAYEDFARKNTFTYGQFGNEVQRYRIDKMREFSREVVYRQLSRNQTDKARKSLKRAADRDPNLRSKPLVVAGTLTSIYFNNPVEFSMGDETHVAAQTSIPDQTGAVRLASPFVDGRFELDGHADDGLAPGTVPTDPTFRREKYRFSVSRPVGLLDITTGVSYGSTTTQLSTSLTKPISDHVTCVLDSVRPMDAPAAAAEERVRFLYGISF
ncbi:MAG TPA: hypothetical protein VM598_11075 [Bdellovibrionota bacterium]|nr:hypothetical protein [Bdellovibrionota bacterium]